MSSANSSDASISPDLRTTIFIAGSAYSPSTFAKVHLYEPALRSKTPAHSKAPPSSLEGFSTSIALTPTTTVFDFPSQFFIVGVISLPRVNTLSALFSN